MFIRTADRPVLGASALPLGSDSAIGLAEGVASLDRQTACGSSCARDVLQRRTSASPVAFAPREAPIPILYCDALREQPEHVQVQRCRCGARRPLAVPSMPSRRDARAPMRDRLFSRHTEDGSIEMPDPRHPSTTKPLGYLDRAARREKPGHQCRATSCKSSGRDAGRARTPDILGVYAIKHKYGDQPVALADP